MNSNLCDLEAMREAFRKFSYSLPFPYCVVDGFVNEIVMESLLEEFLPFNHPAWFVYDNPVENKKALNNWNLFPPATYSFFRYLTSPEFVSVLSEISGIQLFADPGLHGGGWHIHGAGGNLNPHLDYSIHPKCHLQRRVNLIVYAEPRLEERHGGHLGLWDHDPERNLPGKLVREIQPRANRAVFFDTSRNSWHGISRPLVQPEGICRKSFAVYYLCIPGEKVDPRGRALFAPKEGQSSEEIADIIVRRSGIGTSGSVYRI